MRVARALVEGCDIWLNNPIRPREASGTSGEKAALNGVLNCSILDGWWAEMYDGANGWAIESSDDEDPEVRDAAEATALIETLGSIREMYHGDRPGFNDRIRHAWRTLGPRVTAARMLRDYMADVYGPTLSRARP
jgi:starch phosphorylase